MDLKCHNCNAFMGEMKKGKLHKKAVILCEKCYNNFLTYKSLADQKYNPSNSSPSSNSSPPFGYDLPDFFNGLFNKK